MNCPIHGCKMVIVKLGAGWGSEHKYACPICQEEKQGETGNKGRAEFTTARPGWQ